MANRILKMHELPSSVRTFCHLLQSQNGEAVWSGNWADLSDYNEQTKTYGPKRWDVSTNETQIYVHIPVSKITFVFLMDGTLEGICNYKE